MLSFSAKRSAISAISNVKIQTLGEYNVDSVMEDKMAGTWVLTLRIPYEGSSNRDMSLLVAEEAEEAGRSVV